MKDYHFPVPQELAGERLDIAATVAVRELTRARAQKLLKEGCILVDGNSRRANYRVRESEIIRILIPDVRPADPAAEDIRIDVLFEDTEVLVLNKPKGLVVHPAAGHAGGTLVNALLHHCRDLSGIGGIARPGIVHRLDKDTSGVLVVAKSDRAHLSLARQFKEHSVLREYVAVVHGVPEADRGIIDGALARHPQERKKMAVTTLSKGRRAVTHFTVLERFAHYAYLSLRLETGRTHQIRVHLASIGYPVAGDPVYGYRKKISCISGQALHARLLGFAHPLTGRYMEFTGEAPEEFQSFLTSLRDGQYKETNSN